MADGKLRYIKPTKGYSAVTCGIRDCGNKQMFHARTGEGAVANCTQKMAARMALDMGWARYKRLWVCPDHASELYQRGHLSWKVIGRRNGSSAVTHLRILMTQDLVPPPFEVVARGVSFEQATSYLESSKGSPGR